MDKKIKEAQEILKELGLPEPQQNKLCALTLLALCGIKPSDAWNMASSKSMTLAKDIMAFINTYYNAEYKTGTRESFRKQALNPFIENDLILLNPNNLNLKPTSPLTNYAITNRAINLIKKFDTSEWSLELDSYKNLRNNFINAVKPSVLIKTMHINSYKSIEDDTIDLGQFNVFIGINGSGKTNILEALATVGAERGNDMNFEGLSSRGVRIARPNLILSSFLSNKPSKSLEINLTLEINNVPEEYKCSLTPANLSDIYTDWINNTDEEQYPDILFDLFTDLAKGHPNIADSTDFLEKLNVLIRTKGLKRIQKFDKVLSEYLIFDLNTRALRGISAAESKKTPVGINGEGLDLLISSFSSPERAQLNKCFTFFDWLGEIIADKDDKFKASGLKPGRSVSTLYFKDKYMQKDNNIFSAENSNEGILHVLFYLALFISSKTPRFFAIDNIETALNPRLCQVLISELVKLSKENEKQVLITTHNPAILDGLNLLDDDQRLFEVFRDDQGKTKTRRIKFKSDLSDKKFKLSEMWLKGSLGAVPKYF